MQNSLLIGLSRQVTLARELEVVANNIANINTTGFKADNAMFGEYLSETARDQHVSGAGSRVSFVLDRATWHDLSGGPVQVTNNALDVSINGEGFLVVQAPGGERYTRNGALQLNSTGQLVTSEGYPVIGEGGPIQFQNTDRGIQISKDGTISVREGTSPQDSLRGKLRVVTFANRGQLQKEGSGLFSAPAGVAPQPDLKSNVVQGTLEKSNVRAVVEMSRMIEITRSYTQVANMLQQESDLRKSAIEKLADVPA